MAHYDLDQIAEKMEQKISAANIPIQKPVSIAFSTDSGAANGVCFVFERDNGDDVDYAIRLNPRLDCADDVSPIFIEALMAHELLHCYQHRGHSDGWRQAAQDFVNQYPEYIHVYDNRGVGILTEKFLEDDPEKEKAYVLPFHPQGSILVCTNCHKRQYFPVYSPGKAREALKSPCPACGGTMKTLFKRVTCPQCGSNAKKFSDLKSTYRAIKY